MVGTHRHTGTPRVPTARCVPYDCVCVCVCAVCVCVCMCVTVCVCFLYFIYIYSGEPRLTGEARAASNHTTSVTRIGRAPRARLSQRASYLARHCPPPHTHTHPSPLLWVQGIRRVRKARSGRSRGSHCLSSGWRNAGALDLQVCPRDACAPG